MTAMKPRKEEENGGVKYFPEVTIKSLKRCYFHPEYLPPRQRKIKIVGRK
jgi:hypothetical protein